MKIQGSEEIRTLLSTPIPDVLWHYTSLEGLKGIADSKKIWATDIRFLNDSDEYKHAVDLLKDEAEKIDEPVRELVLEVAHQEFLTGVLSPSSMPVFVTSFSAARDLLSQWRAYASENKGVSIGFDLRGIRPDPQSQQLLIFAPCVYMEEDKRALLRSALQALRDGCQRSTSEIESRGRALAAKYGHLAESEWEQTVQSELGAEQASFEAALWQSVKRTLFDLVPIMPLLKHSSFREEQEWRLVAHADPQKLALSDEKKTRVGKASLIPYLDLDLPRSSQTGMPNLTELLMGPTPNMERSILAAKTLLDWNGFSSVEPRPSATSFRSW